MQFPTILSIAYIYTQAVEWIASWITHHFYWLHQYHKHSYRGESGGWWPWGAMKWFVNPLCKLKTAKWHQLVLFSVSHNTTKQLNPSPTSPASCVAGWLLVQGRSSHSKITHAFMDIWQNSETSHSKSSLGNYQHWYLADMLANVYSYCVMVKSVSYCMLHAWKPGFLKPVTYIWSIHMKSHDLHNVIYIKKVNSEPFNKIVQLSNP